MFPKKNEVELMFVGIRLESEDVCCNYCVHNGSGRAELIQCWSYFPKTENKKKQ